MARRKFDFYETPPHYVQALVKVIDTPQGSLFEPCVGQGQLLLALPRATDLTVSNDLDARRPARFHRDATQRYVWQMARRVLGGTIDWTITNPPFKHELPILRHALRYSHNVAMLARLSFLEPTIERRLFWARWQSTCEVIVLPRYSFKQVNGRRASDNMTCCWLVFRERRDRRLPARPFEGFRVALNREAR